MLTLMSVQIKYNEVTEREGMMGQRHYGNITGVKKCNEGENSKRGEVRDEGRQQEEREKERDMRGTTCRI